jgi:outer membrane protein
MKLGIVVTALQAVLLSILFCSNTFAADLLEVWQAAKVHDPEYLAAQSDKSAGEARRQLGDTLLRPSVNFVAGAGIVNENSSTTGAQVSMPGFGTFSGANFNTSINYGARTKVGIQASQPLYDRELSAQKGQLQLSADVSDMGMIAADKILILQVAENYFETLKSQSVINLLIEQQNAVSNTYSEISKRHHLGDASKIDLQETAEQVEAIKAKLQNVQLAYKNNLLMLKELTGQNFTTNTLEESFNVASISVGSFNEWIGKAKLQNPQLKILAIREQIQLSEIDKYNSSLSPKVNLFAQIERDEVNGYGDFGSASNTTSNNMIGVQLTVPLTDGYRSAKKDEAYYLAEKAKQEYEHASLQIEKQINSTWFALNTGKDRIASLNRIVALSKERLDATEKSHRQGARTTLELLGAQSDYISSKLVLLEEQVNLIVNRIRLSSIAGDISEQDLVFAIVL